VSNDRIKYLTCHKCSSPLFDNQLVKDGYTVNTVHGWTRHQLDILQQMVHDRVTGDNKTPLSLEWIDSELIRIMSKSDVHLKY
jgi:hypothetical protein